MMDKRREPRIEHKIRFFVHVCLDDPDLVGMYIACEAVHVHVPSVISIVMAAGMCKIS